MCYNTQRKNGSSLKFKVSYEVNTLRKELKNSFKNRNNKEQKKYKRRQRKFTKLFLQLYKFELQDPKKEIQSLKTKSSVTEIIKKLCKRCKYSQTWNKYIWNMDIV